MISTHISIYFHMGPFGRILTHARIQFITTFDISMNRTYARVFACTQFSYAKHTYEHAYTCTDMEFLVYQASLKIIYELFDANKMNMICF